MDIPPPQSPSSPAPSAPAPSFKHVLAHTGCRLILLQPRRRAAQPLGAERARTVLTPDAALAARQQARAAADQTAHELTQARRAMDQAAGDSRETRAKALLAQELNKLLLPAPVPAPPGATPATSATGAGGPSQASGQAEALAALVERIQVFMKAARPALSLTVGGRLGGELELERLGPGEVAVRFQRRGKAGLDAPTVEALRRELGARGIRLARFG